MNDEFHALLRDAAEKREARARDQATEDRAAAGRQFDALLKLARSKVRGPRAAQR